MSLQIGSQSCLRRFSGLSGGGDPQPWQFSKRFRIVASQMLRSMDDACVGQRSALSTERPECVTARPQLGHETPHDLCGMTTIGTRILVVTVVNDDDVAGRGLTREPRRHPVRMRLLPPVPVPHPPAPPGEAIPGAIEPLIHRRRCASRHADERDGMAPARRSR